MNLLLLDETELRACGAFPSTAPQRAGTQYAERGTLPIRLSDRRALHLLEVLGVEPGASVRAGIINHGAVQTRVAATGADWVELELGELQLAPPPRLHVIVAMPRPKALSRIVSAVASFGVASLALINCWKVEKSYFSSPRLTPERLREDLLLGCEQGAQVHLPQVSVHRTFMSFIKEGDAALGDAKRLVFHLGDYPQLPQALALQQVQDAPDHERSIAVAFGPEGGLIDREVTTLQAQGYQPVRMDTGPLRTEVALTAALGQLLLCAPDVFAPCVRSQQP